MAQLKSHEEKRLAHKILAFLAAQYVWLNGDEDPAEVSPFSKKIYESVTFKKCSDVVIKFFNFKRTFGVNCFPIFFELITLTWIPPEVC